MRYSNLYTNWGVEEHFTRVEECCDCCDGSSERLKGELEYVPAIKQNICFECIENMTLEKAAKFWPFADLEKLSEELNLIP